MAGGSDGSVIIDTTLDNSGFEKGSEKMKRSIQGLVSGFNSVGASAGKGIQQVTANAQEMARAVEEAAKGAQGFDNNLLSASSTAGFSKEMSSAEKSCTSLEKQMQRLGDSERMGIKTNAQMTRFQINVEKARDGVTQLEQELQRLGAQNVKTPAYESVEAMSNAAGERLIALQNRQQMMEDTGVKKKSAAWKRVQLEIDNTIAKLEQYEARMQQLESSGQAYMPGQDSARYQQTASALQNMQAQLAHYEELASNFDTVSAPASNSEKSLKKVDSELRQKPKDAGIASNAISAFGNALKGAGSAALRVSATLARITFKGLAAGAKAAANGLKGYAAKAADGALTSKGLVKSLTSLKTMLVRRIKETFIRTIFNDLGASMNNLAKYSSAFNAAMSSMKNSTTGLSGNIAVAASNLVNTFAPAISTIIDWISQAISYLNAFFALLSGKSTMTIAKKSTDDYAKSLKGAGGAAKDLKNQVYGFDQLNKEQDKSGGGGGASSGAEFQDVSIASYLPESLMNLFNSIKAAFEAGEWEKIGYLISDSLNTVVVSVDSWITGTLEPAAVTWADRIARIINGFVSGLDWNSVGITIGDGLNVITRTVNQFVSSFDWVSLGAGLGAGANGLVSGIDWNELGAFISAKANVIWQTIYGFVTTFDWANLGQSLATGANSAFESINWVQLAEAVGTGINGIWTTLWTAISEFDWTTAGVTLADAVNALFASEGGPIDWKLAGESLSNGLKGLIDGINTFLSEVNWQQIGEDVSTFISAIDWSGLLSSLCEGIGTALAGIAEAIWVLIEPAWNDVVAWWDEEMEKNGGDLIATLLSGIVTALTNISQWCLDNIVSPILSSIESALGLSDGTIADVAADLWNGLANGLATSWNNLKTTLLKPFSDFWQAVKDFFGIASPSTEAASIGDFILQGFSGGLSSGVETVLGVVSDVFGRIWNAIKSIFGFGNGSEESKEAKQAGKDIMSGMQEGIKGDEEAVKTQIRNAAKAVLSALRNELGIPEGGGSASKTKTIGESIVSGIKDGIDSKGVESTFSSSASNVWSAVKNALNKAFGIGGFSGSASESKYVGEGTVSGIKDGITKKGVKATFTTAADTTLSAVKQALQSAFGIAQQAMGATAIEYVGTSTVMGIYDGINKKAVAATFSTVANNVRSAVSSAMNTALGISGSSASKFEEVGKAICQGVANGISSNTSVIKNAATRAASAALSAAKAKLGIHSPSTAFAEIGEYMMQGMSNGLSAAQGTVMRTISGIAASVSDGFSGQLDGVMPEISVSDGKLVSSVETVADRLTGIAAVFSAIADAINSMGGLAVPQIATGSVVPYQSRVDTTDSVADPLPGLAQLNDSFDDSVVDLLDVLKEILQAIKNLDLVVDANSLERALSSVRRSRIRAYGG